ncbi:hypothetical protein BU15DRAFT_68676 [Melanogaster broomeanus]|nr:hypothetical protein BU15DRAFT_68676 [Melanogaster broomeanus]
MEYIPWPPYIDVGKNTGWGNPHGSRVRVPCGYGYGSGFGDPHGSRVRVPYGYGHGSGFGDPDENPYPAETRTETRYRFCPLKRPSCHQGPWCTHGVYPSRMGQPPLSLPSIYRVQPSARSIPMRYSPRPPNTYGSSIPWPIQYLWVTHTSAHPVSMGYITGPPKANIDGSSTPWLTSPIIGLGPPSADLSETAICQPRLPVLVYYGPMHYMGSSIRLDGVDYDVRIYGRRYLSRSAEFILSRYRKEHVISANR